MSSSLRRVAVSAALALVLPAAAAVATAGGPATDLSDYPRPAASGASIAAGVEEFAAATPLRITGTPVEDVAAQRIIAEATSLGLQVEQKTYAGVLRAIVARKPGTDRAGETLVFGGHYDSMLGTVTGTYDNGTGVRMVMELARAYAKVPTHRSMEFVWFNGEEQGAFGSSQLAPEYAAAGKRLSAYLGFDMVGIAWPVGVKTGDTNCLCIWRGARDLALDGVLRKVHTELDLPLRRDAVSLEGANQRNSDEASFADAGYRTLRWAGMRAAADYPQYHLPQDDITTIEQVAGGRTFFEQGLRNTLLSAYYTAAALDLDPKPAPARQTGVTATARIANVDRHTHTPQQLDAARRAVQAARVR